MFSKLLNSARSILNPGNNGTAPSASGDYQDGAPPTMVTTRGSMAKVAAEDSQSDGDTIVVQTPVDSQSDDGDTIVVQTPVNSSRKRQRSTKKGQPISLFPDEASPTKKRKLPSLTKDDSDTPRIRTHVAVEIPVSQVAPGSAARITRSKRAGKDLNAKLETMAEVQDSEFDEEGLESPIKSKSPGSTKSPVEAEQSKKDAEKSSGVEPVQSKHKRFGSEEPAVDVLLQTSREEPIMEIKSDVEDSDDDAPEEVITQDAAEHAKKSLRDAKKALEEQESAIRKKRKERDAFLKRQAEAASKKRKHEEGINERPKSPTGADILLAEALLSPKKTATAENDDLDQAADKEFGGVGNTSEDESDDSPALDEEQKALSDASPSDDGLLDVPDSVVDTPHSKFASIHQVSLPDLLPAEYLDDDDAEDAEMVDEEETRKAKKTKFSSLREKKPKDLRKGSTTFRVVGSQNLLLAPKASAQARSTKESWLQGRPGKKGQTNRKPFSSGFFVAKK